MFPSSSVGHTVEPSSPTVWGGDVSYGTQTKTTITTGETVAVAGKLVLIFGPHDTMKKMFKKKKKKLRFPCRPSFHGPVLFDSSD